MDNLTPAQRSATMARVRGRNTKPELAVRRIVHAMGYRFRLYRSSLPGKPDLVFPQRRMVIFVHGCFWHGHRCRAGTNRPKSNRVYWRKHFRENQERDQRKVVALSAIGWRVIIQWECEIEEDANHCASVIRDYLGQSLGKRTEDRTV